MLQKNQYNFINIENPFKITQNSNVKLIYSKVLNLPLNHRLFVTGKHSNFSMVKYLTPLSHRKGTIGHIGLYIQQQTPLLLTSTHGFKNQHYFLGKDNVERPTFITITTNPAPSLFNQLDIHIQKYNYMRYLYLYHLVSLHLNNTIYVQSMNTQYYNTPLNKIQCLPYKQLVRSLQFNKDQINQYFLQEKHYIEYATTLNITVSELKA